MIDDIWQNRDRNYNVRCLVKRLQRIDKEMPGDARAEFAAFVPDGDLGRYARELMARLDRDFGQAMHLLRNEAFQDLLQNYRRPDRRFLIAPEAEDDVSSGWLIRDGQGNEYKPEDYLAAFARYVQENPDHIDAVRILLGRPRDWSTEALGELRQKLAGSALRFTEGRLQKVHEVRYHKSLVDIISMVKHAASESAPLLTAAERVDAALERLAAGRTFTPEQQTWLARIREHLASNLSIAREDFGLVPVLEQPGGWGSANRAFGGKLAELLTEINEALAA